MMWLKVMTRFVIVCLGCVWEVLCVWVKLAKPMVKGDDMGELMLDGMRYIECVVR